MKPVAIDLFCGKGGWTNALLEVGFEVYGFDIEPQPDYKGDFRQMDILQISASDLEPYNAVFATCSSPCEQFSVHGMPCFHPNPKHPEMGIQLFNHSRGLLEDLCVPYVMENVRSAEKFIGKAVNHCGPFYLWGTAVPAVFSRECYNSSKGFKAGGALALSGASREEITAWRRKNDPMWSNSKSQKRKDATAAAAMIPLPIARAVAELAANLCLEGCI